MNELYKDLLENEKFQELSKEIEKQKGPIVISGLSDVGEIQFISALKEKLNNLEIKEDTLTRRIRANIATLVLGYDSISGVNEDIQDDLVIYGRVVDNLKDIYASITLEEVKDVIQNISTKDMATIILLPNEKAEE